MTVDFVPAVSGAGGTFGQQEILTIVEVYGMYMSSKEEGHFFGGLVRFGPVLT